MHGLCNRALHCFLRLRLGEAGWNAVARQAGAPAGGFEAFGQYDDALTARMLVAAGAHSGLDRETLLEDLGTWLVSDPCCEAIRRLLRFGGADFAGFVFALEDLPDRARLAVPDLVLPDLSVVPVEGGVRLVVGAGLDGFAAVVAGLVRAMADDYGTLVVLTALPDAVELRLVEADFAEGRRFALAG
ncbi:heme NO-binding protein [Gemmobacter aquarius]|uniref:Heme NO-binding protein n=1 Tax=Paragemmobacter aquarius TaxID=2169400 RepID=A0A2S0UJK0_9RHOB|nr:heme NO-binding protein [Gemmobacter aquarius]